jgi:hypothetical protein
MPVQRICATQGARAVLSCSGAPAQSKAASTTSRGSRDRCMAEEYVRDVIVDEYRRPRRNGGTQRIQPVMSRYRPSGAARSWQRVRPGQLLVWPAATGGVSAGAAHGSGAADGQYSGRGLRGDTR